MVWGLQLVSILLKTLGIWMTKISSTKWVGIGGAIGVAVGLALANVNDNWLYIIHTNDY